jgi:hypothetical protein
VVDDFNGDGIDDVAVGAPGADGVAPNLAVDRGRVAVYFGAQGMAPYLRDCGMYRPPSMVDRAPDVQFWGMPQA